MGKERLEAFSDGVIAIIITIMVLELRPPEGARLEDLAMLAPVFLSYGLSFTYVAIYWVNHHHLLRAAHTISGPVMWANIHLLFWLSMVPFATSWLGEHHDAPGPAALYGAVLILAALAYTVLSRMLVRHHGPDSALAHAVGGHLANDLKGNASIVLYGAAIAVAFWRPRVSEAIYAAVAAMWVIPDRRVERALVRKEPRP